MEREEALERLKKKRTILRTSLSKYGKRLEEYDVHKECDHEELLGQLSDVYEELRRVDEEIGKLIDIKDLEKDLKMVEEYREKAVAWKYLLKKRSLVVAEGMQRETATATKKEYPGEIGRPSLTGMVKLPKLTMERFYGEISQWLNFWNAFDSSINRNEHLTKIDKFNYLKAYLGGTAAQTVEGFCLSEENYDKAVELLKKRFGKGERLIDMHMNNLLALKPLRVTKDVWAFRELYGRILVQIRSLESLGVVVESYGNLLCPLLLKLLPSDLKLELHREFTGAFSLGDLIEFLERQLIALESTFGTRDEITAGQPSNEHPQSQSSIVKYRRNERNPLPTAAGFLNASEAVNKRKNCAFCEGDHESTKCEFEENLTLEDKLGKLKKNQNATPARGMMRDETLTNLTTPVVLLPTLRVTIRGKCKERMGRILIDTGSQRSYVLQDTAEEMGYECSKKESLRHSLFGGSNTELYEHGVYDIRLSNLDGSYGCNFEALSQDVICDSVPRVHQGKWMQDLSAHDIELTDLHRGPLEILIGADIAGKLLTGEHRRLPSGLVAVQTRLGWTLMGKIPATEEETSVSGLCTTSLLTSDLENLWRLEAIGISDARQDDSIQKETEEYFARTISQDCEGRYQVALPWIRERELLTDNRDVAEKRLANGYRQYKREGVHYLSHRPVFKENSPTTKVRPVFDASAKKKGKDNWATFVMNRVMEIRSLSETEDWYHVPGCLNPADLPSRGCLADSLERSKWWEGPSWLRRPRRDWPHREIYPDPEIVNSEKRKIVLTSTCIEREKDQYYYRFSNYYKILRVTAWMNRFLTNARGTIGQRVKGDLTVNEIKRAELMLVRVIQRESFTGPEDKRLKDFKLCCDSLGLLRVKTKISRRQDLEGFRMPLLLPSDHDLVYLLIRWKHETWGHVGLQTLMNLLREDYWILKFRRTVRRVIHQCVKCRRFMAKSGSVESVELPENRVRDASIFEVVGIDLTGPLVLRNRRKVWIVIFTCAVYRAVHLELVTSLSTENFLQAFRRFVARRGRPYVVYSDNGTNFRGASRALGNLDNAVVQSESTKQNINWKFIPPSAPWWGGWWERLIGLLKQLLRKILGQARLEFEKLYTIICDTESLMNSRPLTYMSEDVEDLSPLTPALFLHDLKEIGVPDLDSIERASLQKRYRFRQRLREDLRKRFRTEYFGFLRQETKRRSKTRPIKVGDLVLIGQDNAKRVNWPLARVVEVYPGRDGPVRVAKLRTSKGVQIRPVQRLYNLEIPADLGSTLRSIQSEPRRGGSRGEARSTTSPQRSRQDYLPKTRHPKMENQARSDATSEGNTTPSIVTDIVAQLAAALRDIINPGQRDSDLPQYDGTYPAANFFQQYDDIAGRAYLTETKRLQKLPAQLSGEPLTFFRQLDLANNSYDQARQILIDLYPGTVEVSFSKFLALKLTPQTTLQGYYKEKTAMGLQLNLPTDIILESLTEGLPTADQRLVRTVSPNTLKDWHDLMARIKGSSVPAPARPTPEPTSSRHDGHITLAREQPSRPYNTPPRFFSTPRLPRHADSSVPSQPPSPCHYCRGNHWNAQCPRRQPSGRNNVFYQETTGRQPRTSPSTARSQPARSTPPSDTTVQTTPRSEEIGDSKLPFGILSLNTLSNFKLKIDLCNFLVFQNEAPLPPTMYHFSLVNDSCNYGKSLENSNKMANLATYQHNPSMHVSDTSRHGLSYMSPSHETISICDFASPKKHVDMPQNNVFNDCIPNYTTNVCQIPASQSCSNSNIPLSFLDIINRYSHIFSSNKFDVPKLKIPPVKIHTLSDKIIALRPYRASLVDQREIQEQVNQMLKFGIIEPSFSPYASPVTLTQIEFLGYTIKSGTYTPQIKNLDVINAIKVPTNLKTLQSFLGAINVYNKFIPNYAQLRTPLNKLLKKDTTWNWDHQCQTSFEALKERLTSQPILHLFKEGLPCQLYCDASLLGIAGVLKQQYPDGTLYPVQFYSRALRPHEKNYTISELECLAIIECVDKFRVYLTGVKFTIFTDHHALQWLKTIKNPTGRLFRWSLKMSTYEYEIRYIKGSKQHEADLLSRNPFCGFLSAAQIKEKQPLELPYPNATIKPEGLHTLTRKGVTKVIVPPSLQHTLINKVHVEYNHPGVSQMTRIISTQYTWRGMTHSIAKYVKSCPTCQLIKRPKGPNYGTLGQLPLVSHPFDTLSIDTIAGFSKYGSSKTYLHVIVDHLSRYAWTFPSKSTSTLTYLQCLKRVMQSNTPKCLLSDRAPAFTSPKFRRFLLRHGIQPLLTTSNNPQANGLCERLNATLTGKLRIFHLENPKVSWIKLIKTVTDKYNQTPHTITGFPPSFLMYNIIPTELSSHIDPYPPVEEARKIAIKRTLDRHAKEKIKYDSKHRTPQFEVGDIVLVKSYHHPNSGKLLPYFTVRKSSYLDTWCLNKRIIKLALKWSELNFKHLPHCRI
ncbi:hypothetical protein LAZ67_2005744 [Cordylochernes scorpioides]|uniref:Integrase catalytic domain-containing protein n=1 Tax=Cordylochernes scorpioides TaxID=51811 RepID=A0ABY6K7W8_9ARAC|nr:hypothetical protein LAZ67_2005744 [Cordylochernes scorpioides]